MEEIADVFLSPGVLANICATDRADAILASYPYRCVILESVFSSLPVLWDISTRKETKIDCQARVTHLLERGFLHLIPSQREFSCVLVLLERYLREELANLFAVAHIHSGAVALDDWIIKKRVSLLLPGLSIISTLSILHHWQEVSCLAYLDMQDIAVQIIQYAHFQPSAQDPLYPWWQQLLSHREKSK